MSRLMTRMSVLLLSLMTFAAAAAGTVNTLKPGLLGKFEATDTAILGYDTVAYFTEGKPVPGKPTLTTEWNGAKWQFSSAANRELFKAAPQKYAPQYGGYCAYGVSSNYLVKIDPEAFAIVGGKLYLNYNPEVQKLWTADPQGFIGKADANYPALLKQ